MGSPTTGSVIGMTCSDVRMKTSPRVAVGDLLGSEASAASFLVLDVGEGSPELTIDGTPLTAARPIACSHRPVASTGDSMHGGERFADPVSGLVLRCTHSGTGSLAVDGRPLTRLDRRPGAHHGS